MFGMGMGELLLIMVIALLVVGPEKLPTAAKAIGKGIRDLRRHTLDLQQTLEQDENIGEAVRELKSALQGDPARPPRPVSKPAPAAKPSVDSAAAAPAAPAEEGLPTLVAADGSVAKGEATASAAAAATAPAATAPAATDATPAVTEPAPTAAPRDGSAHG